VAHQSDNGKLLYGIANPYLQNNLLFGIWTLHDIIRILNTCSDVSLLIY